MSDLFLLLVMLLCLLGALLFSLLVVSFAEHVLIPSARTLWQRARTWRL
jgi:hypothetical protein